LYSFTINGVVNVFTLFLTVVIIPFLCKFLYNAVILQPPEKAQLFECGSIDKTSLIVVRKTLNSKPADFLQSMKTKSKNLLQDSEDI
jgi:hypothetical protein